MFIIVEGAIMNAEYYGLTTIWVIFVDLMIAGAAVWLLKKGNSSNAVATTFGILSVVWIGGLHWVFGGQILFPGSMSGAVFYLIILTGVAAAFALFYVTSWKYFSAASQESIQMAHGLRVFLGGGFLMESALGVIPAGFGIMDGFLHITSGFLALIAAIALIKKLSSARSLLWFANIFGIADVLIIATSICFWVWGDLGPNHNIMYVVFYVAPIVLWLHFVSVTKLIRA